MPGGAPIARAAGGASSAQRATAGSSLAAKTSDGGFRARAFTADAIQDAREELILRRETHLDQLADKLREERVRRVVEPLLSGAEATAAIAPDDLQYVRDLGLVTRSGPVAIANPIYREVIPRDLTWTTQEMSIHHDPACYVGDDGALQVGELLGAFQAFFREHSEHYEPSAGGRRG